MTQLAKKHSGEKLLYTAKVHTVGGREHGAAKSSDGNLEIKLSTPGSGRPGTNPEQLLAAGWSACFEGALGIAALKRRIRVEPAIDAEVDLNTGDDGYFLRARLNISLPGVARDIAQALVNEAHATCPYSKALQNSIDIELNLI